VWDVCVCVQGEEFQVWDVCVCVCVCRGEEFQVRDVCVCVQGGEISSVGCVCVCVCVCVVDRGGGSIFKVCVREGRRYFLVACTIHE